MQALIPCTKSGIDTTDGPIAHVSVNSTSLHSFWERMVDGTIIIFSGSRFFHAMFIITSSVECEDRRRGSCLPNCRNSRRNICNDSRSILHFLGKEIELSVHRKLPPCSWNRDALFEPGMPSCLKLASVSVSVSGVVRHCRLADKDYIGSCRALSIGLWQA